MNLPFHLIACWLPPCRLACGDLLPPYDKSASQILIRHGNRVGPLFMLLSLETKRTPRCPGDSAIFKSKDKSGGLCRSRASNYLIPEQYLNIGKWINSHDSGLIELMRNKRVRKFVGLRPNVECSFQTIEAQLIPYSCACLCFHSLNHLSITFLNRVLFTRLLAGLFAFLCGVAPFRYLFCLLPLHSFCAGGS